MAELTAVLLSGGIDSIALAAWCRPSLAITIDYGQSCAAAELAAAEEVCKELSIEHHALAVDCSVLGSGDLAGRPALDIAPASDWWPFRNQLILTLAAALAVRLSAQRLLIGTVQSDEFHSDGTRDFIEQIDRLCLLQEGHVRIDAPAIHLSSVELVKQSGVDRSVLAWAHSCHTGNFACGWCRGCNKHQEVMTELGYESF